MLVTPFDSLAGVAAYHYPYLPVRLLLRDRFESWRYAPLVTAPTRIVVAAGRRGGSSARKLGPSADAFQGRGRSLRGHSGCGSQLYLEQSGLPASAAVRGWRLSRMGSVRQSDTLGSCMAEPSQARRYRFGVFEADVAVGELRRQGIRIKLNAQPFQVLSLLLDRPGELLTREQISRELWPDGTFVDYEHGVNSAVNRIREALGDTAAQPPLRRDARPPRLSLCRSCRTHLQRRNSTVAPRNLYGCFRIRSPALSPARPPGRPSRNPGPSPSIRC